MTFDQWFQLVESYVSRMTGGLSTSDLPDCCFRDWFEDDMSAKAAARQAIREAQS